MIKHRFAFCVPIERVVARTGLVTVAFALLLCAAAFDAGGNPPAVREFDLGIVKRRIEGNATVIRVERGDMVVLRWRTDETVTIHLHGYDLHAELTTTAQTHMRFQASAAGRFPITAHAFGTVAHQGNQSKQHRETTLLYLEVHPR